MLPRIIYSTLARIRSVLRRWASVYTGVAGSLDHTDSARLLATARLPPMRVLASWSWWSWWSWSLSWWSWGRRRQEQELERSSRRPQPRCARRRHQHQRQHRRHQHHRHSRPSSQPLVAAYSVWQKEQSSGHDLRECVLPIDRCCCCLCCDCSAPLCTLVRW